MARCGRRSRGNRKSRRARSGGSTGMALLRQLAVPGALFYTQKRLQHSRGRSGKHGRGKRRGTRRNRRR